MANSKRASNKPARKTANKRRHSQSGRRHNKKTKNARRTRQNWMKKLLFKGGDASHHAENVFGGIGQQNAVGTNNNAIYQNPLGGQLPNAPM